MYDSDDSEPNFRDDYSDDYNDHYDENRSPAFLGNLSEKLPIKSTVGILKIVSTNHIYYIWTIKNLIKHFDASKSVCIQSTEFKTGVNQGNVWSLQLIFHHGYFTIDVQLYLISCKDPSDLNVQLSMLNKTNKKIKEEKQSISINALQEGKIICKFNNFIRELSLNVEKLLSFNNLTLACEIRNSSMEIKKITKHTKTDDLKLFLRSEKLSDVTVSVGESKFNLHKAILASRSPVFLAMFEHDTIENRKNTVEITDVDEKTMKTLILYIYTDEVENLEEKACDILVAADKYRIEGLKSACIQHLSNSLANENVFSILILANIYNAKQLKINALIYIASHLSELIDTPGYKLVETKYQHLINEILVTLGKTM